MSRWTLEQVLIGIGEEGTAATEPVTIVLDRPYLALHGPQTRVPLFVRDVADPTEES